MDKINLSDEQRFKLFPKYRQRIEDFFKEALPPSGIKIEPIKVYFETKNIFYLVSFYFLKD